MGRKNTVGEQQPWGFYGLIAFTLLGVLAAIAFVPEILVNNAVNTSRLAAPQPQQSKESITTTKTVTQLSDTQTQEEVVVETSKDLLPTTVLTPKERVDLENSTRTNISQIIGGAFVIIGVFLTGRNIRATEKNVNLAVKSQVTERFSKAIGYLESDNPVTRLGGIYTLEGIARESQNEWHWQIMQILTTYIRQKSPWVEGESENQEPQTKGDIQTILDVLGRRNRKAETEDQRLNLSGTDLRGYSLGGNEACFNFADFSHAHLDGANMNEGLFYQATFTNAYLTGTKLVLADLQGAKFIDAHLERADLSQSQSSQAFFTKAHMQEAFLVNANLMKSKFVGANLTKANLEAAIVNEADFTGALLDNIQLAGVDPSKAVKLRPK